MIFIFGCTERPRLEFLPGDFNSKYRFIFHISEENLKVGESYLSKYYYINEPVLENQSTIREINFLIAHNGSDEVEFRQRSLAEHDGRNT